MAEISGAAYFQMSLRGPHSEGFPRRSLSNSVRGTALFSFEGTNLEALRIDSPASCQVMRSDRANECRVL